ncbi:MAG: S-layer homology domain-containing protein [Chloroflexota bacterium]|nr:S-layer homology domain-containing protein [Chloroflexota bacterium]MDQ5865782.1 S-layer homology domain-containing protein [Chloroflexota bacterium]
MRTFSNVTLVHRKSILVLLASMLALALVGFSGPVVAGPASPSAPATPQATCPAGGQCFADVPPGSPFYDHANNLYKQDIISGYPCGTTPAEPCDDQNRPYYRPGNSVTRAQMTKFVDLARTLPSIHIDTATHLEPLYSRTTAAGGVGVTGVSTGTNGIGVVGRGSVGVKATSSSPFSYGVLAGTDGAFSTSVYVTSTGSFGYGVSASATGDFGTGIYASGTGTFGNAAIFSGTTRVQGNLEVTGTCTGCTGPSKIDHPQDPANKYLYHSGVESPDMKTIYDGVAVLDAKGEAVVVLPSYFEALNRDFRYQLTTIGGFAQVYVAEKVKGNRFKIAGGKPGMEVSWQVTGVRHDPYSEQYRTPVEEDKPEKERGLYLHPEAHGQPESKQIGNVAPPPTP